MADAKGLVAIFSDENGNVIASATDFGTARPGGFKLIEAQRHRVNIGLAYKVVDAYASPMLHRAMGEYEREQIVRNLVHQHKCKVQIVPVGYTDEETSTL